jgi:ubiquinone/menaquinone biosynthesis C-methylase UbiE
VTAAENQNDADWATRGAYWAKTAPDSVSTTDDLNQLLITLAGIELGSHVLDIASGAGDPAISIALKVGAEGSVTALDVSAEMLAGAQKRATKLGLENITFENGRMESLPFDSSTFDAVTCRFGLMSSEDPVLALQGARRVLKAGKKAAYLTHGQHDKNTVFSVLWPAVSEFLGDKDSDDRGARRFRFSEEGSLEAVFQAAGFSHIEEREVVKTVIKQADERFWQTMLIRAFGARIEGFEESRMEALHASIERAFEPYLNGDRYELLSTDMVACGVA